LGLTLGLGFASGRQGAKLKPTANTPSVISVNTSKQAFALFIDEPLRVILW